MFRLAFPFFPKVDVSNSISFTQRGKHFGNELPVHFVQSQIREGKLWAICRAYRLLQEMPEKLAQLKCFLIVISLEFFRLGASISS